MYPLLHLYSRDEEFDQEEVELIRGGKLRTNGIENIIALPGSLLVRQGDYLRL